MKDSAASYSLSLDKTLRLPCQVELTCNLQFIRMEYEICMQNSGQASTQHSSISVTLQNNVDLVFVQLPHAPCSPAFSLSYMPLLHPKYKLYSMMPGTLLRAHSKCQQFVHLIQVDLACLISLQYRLSPILHFECTR